MPKKPSESRPVFPGDLAEDLLKVAKRRKRPETDLSPLLQALAREWIDKGSYRRREEELQEITDRLSAVEDQLRAITSPSPALIKQTRKSTSAKIDNLAHRVLEHLTTIADEERVTPRITAQEIAAQIARQGDKPTGKKITERIKKLIAMGVVTIEEDSGGRGGRRYRIE
ncbi:MAG: hypothetical protein PWP23_2963 [Candidatus Sumerlaeota bacterium]|jgi:predicted transcriptional regulator|nr:hypothetical protein [Candidatus Sumerlaeota bacterium]